MIDEFLSRLHGVRKSGKGWSARCPGHDDAHNSLSVGVGEAGRILVYCQANAGCNENHHAAILRPLNLTVRDLGPDAGEDRRNGHPQRSEIATYPYRDEAGALLYETVRYEPKDFRQRRPDGRGGRIWNLDSVRRVLYRLPDLRGEPVVYVVEGEKDADRLAELGFAATTSPLGAGKWREEYGYVGQLAAAGCEQVVVIEDHDEAGHKHALDVVASCRQANLAVKHISLSWPFPRRAKGGEDISDWLVQHTADDLWAAVAASPLLQVSEPGRSSSELRPLEATAPLSATVETILAPLDGLEKKPPIGNVEARLRVVASQLDGADPVRRSAVRSGAIDKLKAVKVTGARELVDAALGRRDAEGTVGAGNAIVFDEPQPWPEPVDGAELLEDIAAAYRRLVVLPIGGAEVFALWIAFTYCIDAFDIAPMLVVTSPTMRCGKTTALEISAALAHRPLTTSNITPAALFRMVERYAPTLIVDEADTFLRDNLELAGILNSGHSRAAAYVIRVVGDEHEPRRFSTWGPRMMALIGRLPFPTLADRSIVLELRRRTAGERVDRMRRSHLSVALADIRRRLVRWSADTRQALSTAEPVAPPGLNDRQEDNWRPLLAVADAAGGQWPQRAREVALLYSGVQAEAEVASVALLADIRSLFGTCKVVATDALVTELLKLEERPWPTWNRGKPMTARHLASLLRSFGIRSGTVRVGDATPKGYTLADFADSFARYLSDFESATPPQANADGQLPLTSHPPHDPGVADAKHDLTTDGETVAADVADANRQNPGMTIHEDEVSL